MTPKDYSELTLVEGPAGKLLESIGWEVIDGFAEKLGPEHVGAGGLGRDDQSQPILHHRLRSILEQLNRHVPKLAIDQTLEHIIADRSTMEPTRANQAIWKLLRDGHRATFTNDKGERVTETVRLVDWSDSQKNEFLAVTQFWMVGPLHKRRCDIVCFVNGIPLILFELKASHKDVEHAYKNNLRDYRDAIPQLFTPNAFIILSNGSDTKVGSTYAPWERFGEWKRIDDESEPGVVSLETAIRGTCEPRRLLDLVENFVTYMERPGGLTKIFGQNHQVIGVNAALDVLQRSNDDPDSEGKLGVFWHTQGSGKSLSMLFFTQKVLRKEPGNWTFVVLTDRIELDEQLYGEFKSAGVLDSQVQATSAKHLRQLLGEDHRYVFSLIHKFRPESPNEDMPVCSDRKDVIVITDEAHRTQYKTLALNMRTALPNARFLAFTGTPLIAGEKQLTREVFGEYISTYNFRDSIEDGATVPLYYENRIPELQIINDNFDAELTAVLEAAELDDDQERALSRRFATEYQLITRPERLKRIAQDLVQHFVGRGFLGKAMFVAVDKATAIRMYDLVNEQWQLHLQELRDRLAGTPELERNGLRQQIEFMETTDMAVVVSQAQNEIADMESLGLDIRKHRQRMIDEDLDERFKRASDSLRIVFVCAMWMTGFDVPSCSTVYLDRPMRNHTLMQTIARANRVFPDKENGLIVDYVGVFRRLEEALAIYASDNADESQAVAQSLISDKESLVGELASAIEEAKSFAEQWDVDLESMLNAEGFEFIALRDAYMESLLIDEETTNGFLSRADAVRRLFSAILPDPRAQQFVRIAGVVRNLAEKIKSLDPAPDVTTVSGAVSELLDRSVGAEEYIIRAAAEGAEADNVLDLNSIDFDALAARFATRKRTETKRLANQLGRRLERSAMRNPIRLDLVERFRQLIEQYNQGSINADETLRRLQSLSRSLDEEEARVVSEGLSEEELAVFDLLTRPDPVLTDDERKQVKVVAHKLMQHFEEKLVLDWRKKAETREAARSLIKTVLDEGLPTAYDPETYYDKCERVFQHLYGVFRDDGTSVYDDSDIGSDEAKPPVGIEPIKKLDPQTVSSATVLEMRRDPEAARLAARGLLGAEAFFAIPTEELLRNDETFAVEYKSTARWNMREGHKDKKMEDQIVKTVAAFLNSRGGVLFIGVEDDRNPIGLDLDYQVLDRKSADGFLNWLSTHLGNAFGMPIASRTTAHIDVVNDVEVCRIDVPRCSKPAWARMSDKEHAFWIRVNNTTRRLTDVEAEEYVAMHWNVEAN